MLQPKAGYIDARPLTAELVELSCNARPDHTFGSFATDAGSLPCRFMSAPAQKRTWADLLPTIEFLEANRPGGNGERLKMLVVGILAEQPAIACLNSAKLPIAFIRNTEINRQVDESILALVGRRDSE
jgi:hypothetical protein